MEGSPFQYVETPILASIFMAGPWYKYIVDVFMQEAPEVTEFLKKDDEKFDICIIEILNNEALLVNVEILIFKINLILSQ